MANTIHSFASLKGVRKQNEDAHKIIENSTNKYSKYPQVDYYSIFDGHGGKIVSKYISKILHKIILRKDVMYPIEDDILAEMYNYAENVLIEKLNERVNECGSTALVAIIFKSQKTGKIFAQIINLGDCRAVMCTDKNMATVLTKDHKPHNFDEYERILKVGEKPTYDKGEKIWRIFDLSVSRAFGDENQKKCVINSPESFLYEIKKNYKFIILACDGLWDVFTNEDAVDFVLHNCYGNKKVSKMDIAHKLAEYAIEKGSDDNVSVIIIFFDEYI